MNCPHCGSNQLNSEYKGAFSCGTLTDRNGWYHQTNFCKEFAEFRKPLDSKIQQLESERDALQARVTSQKCLLDQRWEMMRELEVECETKDVSKAVEYVKGLKARVKRLEEVGDQMAAWLNCERNLGNDTYTAHLWNKAKESKP